MTPDGKGADIDVALSDAAIEWLVKLKSGRATQADEAEFQRWRSKSPEHEEAAREAETLWYGVGLAGDQVRAAKRKLARARLTRRTLLGGGALLVVGAGFKASGMIGPRLLADHVTAVGEQRTIALPDGSAATLNGYTALSVEYDAIERSLTLHEGQATFTVSPDTNRPFLVEANGGVTRALGTVFDIDIRPTDTAVTVVEGKVSVSAGGRSGGVGVTADQRVRYIPHGNPSATETVDADTETAWRRGKLIFNNRPLGEVIAEIERHRQGAIVIARPALRTMPVTGVFDIADMDAILVMIEETLPVTVTRLPLVTVLR